jgi:uncharacterized protein (DUF1015 family)
MPRFGPFPGIRYATNDLARVTAPPYDVIDEAERAALAAQDPTNVVRIDLPVDGDDPYAQAGATFRHWIADGTLITDEPSLYLYRMTFTDEGGGAHHTLGVLGALGLEPPGEGDVLPHEHTTPKAKSDRLQLLRATEANLSPIWGLSLATNLSKLLDTDVAEPIGKWRDEDGVGHALWRVSDHDDIVAICSAVASSPVVIADGHHRYETSLAFAAERPDLPNTSATLCFVVELVEDQLTVQPIHRLLAGLPEGTDVRAALSDAFDVEPTADQPDGHTVTTLVRSGRLGLVTPDGFAYLRPRHADERIDSAVLADALSALPPHEVAYQHGIAQTVTAVREGRADAAVLLRPVSVAQIQHVAHAREKMQPKSTFFWPKLRTGIVFRSLR